MNRGCCCIYFGPAPSSITFETRCTEYHKNALIIRFQKIPLFSFCVSQTFWPKHKRNPSYAIFLTAKPCIALRWKDPQPHSIKIWLRVEELNQIVDLVLSTQERASCIPKPGFTGICLSILRGVRLFSRQALVDSELLPCSISIFCIISFLVLTPPPF